MAGKTPDSERRHAGPSTRIDYVRKRIPTVRVPPCRGKTYETLVPDTLDIQERCALAVNGLTGPTDPDMDHMMYFYADFRSNPPIMSHTKSDVCTAKFMESLPLMRLASGSRRNSAVDRVWMESALRMIGPGGLVYWPLMPWAPVPPDWCDPVPRGAKHFALPTWNGRMMGAMTLHMLRDPSGPWEKINRGIIDTFNTLAIREDDYAYLPPGAYVPGKNGPRHSRVDWKPFGIFSSLLGWFVAGIAQFHRASGYEPAVKLAGDLSRFLAFHGEYFGPDGEFLPNNAGRNWKADPNDFAAGPPPVTHRIHFQHHATPLLGLTDHAIAAGDRELCDFVVRSFEWARAKGCGLVGYFPENIDNLEELETSESCEVAAMIGIALKLSAAGLGDYWDDADRWIRNQFAENQLLQSDWVYHVCAGERLQGRRRLRPSQFTPGKEVNKEVPERNIGAFAGWPTANDWYVGHGAGIMHCCTGNATRALYYIWEHILSYARGTLSVNLLLNRPSKWADVHSHIPYAGQVDVVLKRACRRVRIRIPEWVKPRQVRCNVNGGQRRAEWDGRYAVVSGTRAKDTITLLFPIGEKAQDVCIEKQQFVFTTRGNDVVDVYPRGRFCPLYQRSHYRQDATRWKQVTRFVSDESVVW